MLSPEQEQVAHALAAFVHERIAKGQSVRIPGLGTVSVVHQPSRVDEQPGGGMIVRPPRDMVAFRPD